MQDVGVRTLLDRLGCRHRCAHHDTGGHRGGQRRGGAGSADDGVENQGEGLLDPGVHLNRGPTGVAGQRRHQPGALTRHRTLFRGGQGGVRNHLHRSRFHQRR